LNVAQVGIRDNFFDLGGHSLILTKLANRVHDTFRVRLPLRVIFDLPTIERMGQAIIEEQVKGADKVTVNHFLSKLSEMTPEQVSELLKGQERG
jgi:acyl carrier protein